MFHFQTTATFRTQITKTKDVYSEFTTFLEDKHNNKISLDFGSDKSFWGLFDF